MLEALAKSWLEPGAARGGQKCIVALVRIETFTLVAGSIRFDVLF